MSEASSSDEVEQLKGELSRVRFASEDGTFAVCELKLYSGALVTVVGNTLGARPGETVEISGRWQHDRRFGRQLVIQTIRPLAPTTREGIEKYLSSGLIEGIGPVLAGRIVAHFGEDTLDILDERPERILEVDGIGKVRADRIQRAWVEQRQVRGVMVFLQSHGISPTFAARIFKKYGHQAIEVVSQNPYRLAEDIRGIGFQTADAIAMKTGMSPDTQARLAAGLLHALGQAHGEGHVFLPLDVLKARASELLGVGEDMLGTPLQVLVHEEQIVVEPGGEGAAAAVYRAAAHRAEVGAARHLCALVHHREPAQVELPVGAPKPSNGGPNTAPGTVQEGADADNFSGISARLDPTQQRAARAIFAHPVAVITGGPGTGKTTVIQAVVERAERQQLRVALAAPTGRAARRMSEATGREASTLHRLLEFDPQAGGFSYDPARPLPVDLVIVDEASMLDIYLFHSLVRALAPGTRLLLVGDIDQLPSVGPGYVLGDIIASGAVEVVRLTRVFRQEEGSSIIANAHRVNAGELPLAPARKGDELVDFYTINARNPVEAQQLIVDLACERIPQAFGLDPLQDVQILSPMHGGEVGCTRLNELLQQRLHPGAPQYEQGARLWKVGDRVMQTRNNYELEVFNGDIGRLLAIDTEQDEMRVDFDGRLVTYPLANLDELMLAYAITVHKSQGSEYPAVILPMLTQHYVMLQRNLLYTALTRARKLAIIVGSEKAVAIAVQNAQSNQRFTRLRERIGAMPD